MSNLMELKAIYTEETGKNQIYRSGTLTKVFKKWNRLALRRGVVSFYADTDYFWNYATQRLRKRKLDKRFKRATLIKKQRNKYKSVLKLPNKSNDKAFYFDPIPTKDIQGIGGSIITIPADEDHPRLSMWFLRDLIKESGIKGDWRVIMKHGFDVVEGGIGNKGLKEKGQDDNGVKWKSKWIDYDEVIPSTGFYRWYDDAVHKYRINSDHFAWNYLPDAHLTIIFSKRKKVKRKYFKQAFKDGISHCFFTPILEWCEEKLEGAKTKSSQDNYRAKINLIRGKQLKKGYKGGFLDEFADGIPEECLPQVVDKLNIGIVIYQPFGEEPLIKLKSQKKPIKYFSFINTRLNHVDISQYADNFGELYNENGNEPIITTREELNKMVNSGIDCVFGKDMVGVSVVKTLTHVYKLEDPFRRKCSEFEEETGLKYCNIDAIRYPVLQKFIDIGTHWNGTIDFQKTISCAKKTKEQHLLEAKEKYQKELNLHSKKFFEKKTKTDQEEHINKLANLKLYATIKENDMKEQGENEDVVIPKKFNVDDPNVKHIDMKKAYTQFRKCKWYNGFLSKITDFRFVSKDFDWRNTPGFYYICALVTENCERKFKFLNKHLKWFYDENIYTNAELVALEEMGGEFIVKCGAYGIDNKKIPQSSDDEQFEYSGLDFEFDNEMTNFKDLTLDFAVDEDAKPKEIRVPYYSKWVGSISSCNPKKRVFMKGRCGSYLSSMANSAHEDTEVSINDYDDVAKITFKKRSIQNKKHISAQIVAYQRLNMLEQLLNMEVEKLIRICVDGIYFEDHDFEMNDIFDFKDKKTFNNEECSGYLSSVLTYTQAYDEDYHTFLPYQYSKWGGDWNKIPPRKNYARQLYLGAGGTGKTFQNLTDEGLINVVYVAPSWKLAGKMKEEMSELGIDVNVSVHHRFLHEPYRSELIHRFNNIVWDEASMTTEIDKLNLMAVVGGSVCSTAKTDADKCLLSKGCYTTWEKECYFMNQYTIPSKLIFCGDLGFQLPPVVTEEQKLQYKYVKKKGKKVKVMKGKEWIIKKAFFGVLNEEEQVSQMNAEGFDNVIRLTKNYRNGKCKKLTKRLNYLRGLIKMKYHHHAVAHYFEHDFPYDKFQTWGGTYDKHDLIICPEKKTCNGWTNKYKDVEKFKIKMNCRDYCNGQIVFEKPPKVDCELRHGFTIHAIQGETAKADLIIDTTRMKSLEMFYTAISRAKNYNQIFLVVESNDLYPEENAGENVKRLGKTLKKVKTLKKKRKV